MDNQKTNYDFSKYSEEVISEKDLPSYLCSLESQALVYIQNNDLQTALSVLKRSEEIMESISAQGGMLSNALVISILHNIAFCYQE